MDAADKQGLSRFGIASLVMGVIGLCAFSYGLHAFQRPAGPDPRGELLLADVMTIAIFLGASALVHVAGAICAIIGLFRGGRPRWLCITGLLVNLGALPLVASIPYIATMLLGALF